MKFRLKAKHVDQDVNAAFHHFGDGSLAIMCNADNGEPIMLDEE